MIITGTYYALVWCFDGDTVWIRLGNYARAGLNKNAPAPLVEGDVNTYRCTRCRQRGHNVRRCKEAA
jgi:hypothetical protein